MTRAWPSIDTELNEETTKRAIRALEDNAEEPDAVRAFSKARDDLEFAVTEAQSIGRVGEALHNCLKRIESGASHTNGTPEPEVKYNSVHNAIEQTYYDCLSEV